MRFDLKTEEASGSGVRHEEGFHQKEGNGVKVDKVSSDLRAPEKAPTDLGQENGPTPGQAEPLDQRIVLTVNPLSLLHQGQAWTEFSQVIVEREVSRRVNFLCKYRSLG